MYLRGGKRCVHQLEHAESTTEFLILSKTVQETIQFN